MSAIRTITSDELNTLRSETQWSRLYLAGLEAPRVVFAAQVNQAFPAWDTWDNKARDMILEIEYDNVTQGAYTDIIPGMTLWVGTAAGKYDIGVARVRKAADATKLYIGEISEIKWEDNLYLTVIDEFGLWPKHVRISGGTVYMDGDIAYSDQHSVFAPVPVMGSDVVLDVDSYPKTVKFDGSKSWVFGSSISAYLWNSGGVGSWSSTSSDAPTLTVNSYPPDGLIRVSLRVTSAAGRQTTGYRYIRVYDSTHPPKAAQIAAIAGDAESGGWEFTITLLDDCSTVRDRTPVILFTRDYYGNTRAEMGQQEGRENILAAGYVDGESIEYNSQSSAVSFSVKGPHYWLDRISGFPPGVEIQKTATGAWTSMPALTVDRALWHLLHWRSTATTVMDIYRSGNSFLASAFEVPMNSIWQQIMEISQTSILVSPGCDRYGRLHLKVEPQLVPVADRTSTSVMTIQKQDWVDSVKLGRRIVSEAALLDLSGVAVDASGSGLPFFSLSPGHIFKHYGSIEVLDRMLLQSQAQANELAGLSLGMKNNPIPEMEIQLAANNHLIDVFPPNYMTITVDAADNVRGLTYSGRVIPRSISSEWNAETGFIQHTVMLEAESFPELAIDGDPPANNPVPPTPPPPKPPPPPPPGGGGVTDDGPPFCVISTTNFGYLFSTDFNKPNPKWYFMNSGLTDHQRQYVMQLQKTTDGLLVACVKSTVTGYIGSVHMAYVGGAWSLLVDDTMIDQGTYGNPAIVSVGVDPDSGRMMMVAGGSSALNVGTKKTYSGSPAGFGLSDATPLDITNESSGLTFDGGSWLLTTNRASALSPASYQKISAGGTLVGTLGQYTTQFLHQGRSFHKRGGGNVYVLTANTGGNLRVIANNDPTVETIYTLPYGFGTFYKRLAVSPSGSFLMGGGPAIIGQRSSDGGATWGNVGTSGGMTVGYDTWGNCGDDSQWVSATTQKVLLTLDWGSSWIDKTGNLAYLAPACGIEHIMAWY